MALELSFGEKRMPSCRDEEGTVDSYCIDASPLQKLGAMPSAGDTARGFFVLKVIQYSIFLLILHHVLVPSLLNFKVIR
jgi:hypothetical protein